MQIFFFSKSLNSNKFAKINSEYDFVFNILQSFNQKKIINILTANFSKYNSVSIILLPRYLLKRKAN
jgi:hypothetical protein